MSKPLISLHGAIVDFAGHRGLGPVTATFAPGTSVALMGSNGSGKTTLLRLLAGLTQPTTGSIQRPNTAVAYVAQHQAHHTFLPLTVNEVVLTARYRDRGLLRPLRRTDRAMAADCLERLQVADLAKRSFNDLSGGQRQRVLVARALTMDAPVLLLDEPITGLDLPSQQIILDVVAAERDAGRLVALSTHHLDEAQHCERVVLLNTTVVADGTPTDVLIGTHLAAAFGAQVVVDPEQARVEIIDHHGHGTHHAEHNHG